jgi:hypothetical protein
MPASSSTFALNLRPLDGSSSQRLVRLAHQPTACLPPNTSSSVGTEEPLRPLSFRPSQINARYFIGNKDDAKRHHHLAFQCDVKLIVNCCAANIGISIHTIQRRSATKQMDSVRSTSPRASHSASVRGQSDITTSTGTSPFVSEGADYTAPSRDSTLLADDLSSLKFSRSNHVLSRGGGSNPASHCIAARLSNVLCLLREYCLMNDHPGSDSDSSDDHLHRRLVELRLPLLDSEDFELLPWLEAICPTIAELFPPFRRLEPHDGGGTVMIHCLAGISRSTSILMGILMCGLWKSPKGPLDACVQPMVTIGTRQGGPPAGEDDDATVCTNELLQWVRQRRRFASPNPTFMTAIKAFELRLRRDPDRDAIHHSELDVHA